MPFQKGQSGNPKGRPRTGRAIAEALRVEAGKAREYKGQRMSSKRVMAAMAWDGITTGEIAFSNGTKLELSEEGILSLLKFVAVHMDGAKPAEVRLGGENGDAIEHTVRVIFGDNRHNPNSDADAGTGD